MQLNQSSAAACSKIQAERSVLPHASMPRAPRNVVQPNSDCVGSVQPRRVHSTRTCAVAAPPAPTPAAGMSSALGSRELLPGFSVVIAGAGISGLTLALSLLKRGVKVQILERDLTAIRGEGKIRGPIQIQSNALAALEAIDFEAAAEIMRHGCITGDRINGLCDGVSGDWYCKFDTFHVAVDRGLPVTRVINRVALQEVLAEAVLRYGGPDVIQGGCHVVSYDEFKDTMGQPRVAAVLEDGRRVEGDLLVGTDGIWSKIRKQLLGDTPANYSQYTCYTGISDYVPADIDLVGYRVFLGSGQYFVSSDVGEGKMQWYAFHQEKAGGQDDPGQRKARLLKLFGHWNYNVVDLIKATPETDVLRRDIYDRAPVASWAQGRVVLMGDSAHAMQPNLGQGGCMAIEDAFELANDLVDVVGKAVKQGTRVDINGCLKRYQSQRMMRVATIHGMAGMAALMASTYKAYLGEGMGPLSWIADLHIPHPGRVIGQQILKLTMPAVLGWVLGGNTEHTDKARVPHCKIGDKPRHFHEADFPLLMADSGAAMAERAGADWLLVAERVVGGSSSHMAPAHAPVHASHTPAMAMAGAQFAHAASVSRSQQPAIASHQQESHSDNGGGSRQQHYGLQPFEYKGTYMNQAPPCKSTGKPTVTVGSCPSCHVVVAEGGAGQQHAQVVQEGPGRFVLQDLGAGSGTWVNGLRIERGTQRALVPGDVLEFGRHPAAEVFRVKLQHLSYGSPDVHGDRYQLVNEGAMMSVA